MSKILFVEDDSQLAQFVVDALETGNHTVEHVDDGKEGFERLGLYQYDLAILDVNLPNMEGLEICKRYRSAGGMIPILMLTGRSAIQEKTAGLDSGADDYLTKPFAVAELLSRVRALLRRPTAMVAEKLCCGEIEIDVSSAEAKKNGQSIKLLPKEFALLVFFMRNVERVFSAADLLNSVWSSESDATEDAARQTILRLRKKIDGDDDKNSYVQTIKGIGYKFVDATKK